MDSDTLIEIREVVEEDDVDPDVIADEQDGEEIKKNLNLKKRSFNGARFRVKRQSKTTFSLIPVDK